MHQLAMIPAAPTGSRELSDSGDSSTTLGGRIAEAAATATAADMSVAPPASKRVWPEWLPSRGRSAPQLGSASTEGAAPAQRPKTAAPTSSQAPKQRPQLTQRKSSTPQHADGGTVEGKRRNSTYRTKLEYFKVRAVHADTFSSLRAAPVGCDESDPCTDQTTSSPRRDSAHERLDEQEHGYLESIQETAPPARCSATPTTTLDNRGRGFITPPARRSATPTATHDST